MGSTGEGLEMEMEMEMEITGFLAVDPQRSELDKKKKKREKKREKEGPEYWSLQRKKNNRSPTIIVVVSKEEKEERMKKRVQVGFGEKFRTFCENEKLLDATIMSAKDEMDSFLTHFYPLCTDCSAMITSVVGSLEGFDGVVVVDLVCGCVVVWLWLVVVMVKEGRSGVHFFLTFFFFFDFFLFCFVLFMISTIIFFIFLYLVQLLQNMRFKSQKVCLFCSEETLQPRSF